jgi:hypothetical protein
VSYNDQGFYFESTSNYNRIYHNNIHNNTNQAEDYGTNYWNDSYPSGGNYWSDYTGVDNDSDGIGDISYNISGGSNQDRYPFMEPNGWEQKPPLTFSISGGFGVSLKITNSETINATDVPYWNHVEGGILGRINKTASWFLSNRSTNSERCSAHQ